MNRNMCKRADRRAMSVEKVSDERQQWQGRWKRMRESIKARTTKSTRRGVSRVRGRKDRRGSTCWTAGPGSLGSSSGSGHTVNVILSSHLLEMQQPKLYSNLTFQKHRLIQLSFGSLLLPTPPITFFPSLPFSICSLLSSSLIPVTFPRLLIYFSPLLPLFIFLSITLPRYVSFSDGSSPSFCLPPH